MTFDQFQAKHLGKGVDYDGVCGVMCVDLAKCYLDEVFGIKAGAWGDAHAYYDNFTNIPQLVKNFTRIPNIPSFVPKKGDIMVWGTSLNGNWGHIAICTGEGDTNYFYSLDQNWTGNNDACAKIRHNYNHVLGVLRPKDQSKVTGKVVVKPVKKKTTKTPAKTITKKNKKKSIHTIATEVIQGKWGNGDIRKKKLEKAGYNYKSVQAEVNKILAKGK